MKFPRKSLAAAGAAALIVVGGTAAFAGPPWTISVGGSSTGAPASYTAESGPVDFTVPGLNLGCDSSDAAGTITPGATSSTAGVITSTTFDNCVGPLGIPLEVNQTGTWDINITGDNSGGVTPGQIGNVSASVSNPDGLCSFDVSGTVAGSFDENNQALTADNTSGPDTLFVENVNGCFGLILEGDPATFDATYDLAGIANVTVAN